MTTALTRRSGGPTAGLARKEEYLGLADAGRRRILWAEAQMPVLRRIGERFGRERPFSGLRLSACLAVTAETANLVRVLRTGGADVVLASSNPLSTQDDVAASLVRDFGVATFARRGEASEEHQAHFLRALQHEPEVIIDDAADLVASTVLLSTNRLDACPPVLAAWGRGLDAEAREALTKRVIGATEQTTSGIFRLQSMARDGVLPFPVVAVNDGNMKHLFDNRYGTGQSTIEGIVRATGLMLAGRSFVVAGYGWCGRGVAMRARGMGAKVIVTEVDATRALEATMDGFWVMPMDEAAELGDVFCTVTGNRGVISARHFERMKDGAFVANAGHCNVEVDVPALEGLATEVIRGANENVDRYVLKGGRSIHLLAEGRLVNLVAADGHPAEVMDMSFALQALAAEHVVKSYGELKAGIHAVPPDIDEWVARLELETREIAIDKLTPEQQRYLSSWSTACL